MLVYTVIMYPNVIGSYFFPFYKNKPINKIIQIFYSYTSMQQALLKNVSQCVKETHLVVCFSLMNNYNHRHFPINRKISKFLM